MPSPSQLERTVGQAALVTQHRGDTAEERSTSLQFVSGRHHHFRFQNVEVCFRKARIAECLEERLRTLTILYDDNNVAPRIDIAK